MTKKFWHIVWNVLRNKFFLGLVVFTVWIVFFDQNNLIDRNETKKKLNQLKQDTSFYRDKIREEKEKINQLQTSPANLEKFAREQYLMKAPDEDLFIILKKDQAK
jgi:cell division protein DivIC